MSLQAGDAGAAIRRAVAEEAPGMAEVLRRAFAEYAPLYTSEGLAATTPSAERIRARLDEGPAWVALRDGAIVGTVAAVPRDTPTLYVRSMAVLPAMRGARIGEALLAAVERFAAEHGRARLVLSTTPFLARAIRLYERAGFVRSDAGPADLFGTPLFTMEKWLDHEK